VAITTAGEGVGFVSSRELAARVELMALVTAPGGARSLTRSILGHWEIPADAISTAELLVSELVTNAVKFATPMPEPVLVPRAEILTLTLTKLPRRIVIEVADPDSNLPLLDDTDADAESGRGLQLVQAFSKEWSYLLPPSGGKIVYCIISINDQADLVTPVGTSGSSRESL
jgi:anti-sigma regulatory factor (Ser/Thr protein kinase)